MPMMRPTYALLAVLFAVGAFSQMAQALLAREMLVVFLGNEISLGAFYGSWLGWIGVGGLGAAWLHRRRPELNVGAWVRLALFLLPVALALQLWGVRAVRLWIPAPAGSFLPLGDLMGATFLLNLPVGALMGFLFPLAGELWARAPREHALRDGSAGLALLFSAEAVGALLGGALFTMLLVERLSQLRLLGLAMVLPWLAVGLLAARPWEKRGALLAVLLGLLLALLPMPALEQGLEQFRLRALLPGMTLLETAETRYGHVALVGVGGQRSVVMDGRIGESFPNPQQARLEAAYYHAQARAPRRILLLGGVYGGVAEALLDYPGVERLEVVLEDAAAFAMIRPHLAESTQQALADPRLVMHFADGRRFVNGLAGSEGYDLVVSLPGDPSSARQNRFFTREFLHALQRAMAPAGVFCTRVGSASNYLGREVKSYGGSLLATLAEVFPAVAIAPGDTLTFCASATPAGVTQEAKALIDRYRAHPPAGAGVSPALFHAMLPGEQTAHARARLEEEGGQINLDRQPVSFFLNLMIWGKYTASGLGEVLQVLQRLGGWVCVVPAAIISLMLVLGRFSYRADLECNRRQTVAWALAVLGLVAMAVQVLVLYAYQSRIGFVYSRIALLNALFMLGLALGAVSVGRLLARRPMPGLVGVMVVTAAFCGGFSRMLQLPLEGLGLGEEGGFFLLALVAGGVTGMGFPPAVRLLHGSLATAEAEAPGSGEGTLRTEPERRCAVRPHTLVRISTFCDLWGPGPARAPDLSGCEGDEKKPPAPMKETGQVTAAGGLAEAADHLGGALGGLLTGILLMPMLGWEGSGLLLAGLLGLALLPLLAQGIPALHPPRFWRMRVTPSFPEVWLTRLLWWLALLIFVLSTLARSAEPPPQRDFNDEVLQQVSGQAHFTRQQSPFFHMLGRQEAGDAVVSALLASQPLAGEVRGYGGPLNLLLAVDAQGRLLGARLVSSHETPSYIQELEPWLEKLRGFDLKAAPLDLRHVDAMSGATVSSRAILESLRLAATAAAREVFGLELAAPGEWQQTPLWRKPAVQGVAGLLLLSLVAHFRAGLGVRLLFLGATLLVTGIAGNTLLTEMDLASFTLGRIPGWEGHEAWYLMAGAALLLTPLFGPLHCGWLCPFGAAQELISWLGGRLGVRLHPSPCMDRRSRYLKYLLLVGGVTGVWLTEESWMLSFNPMQQLFSGNIEGGLLWLAGVGLVGSLFFFRFWCRALCPMGACLATGNKSALMERFSPARDFHRCDLGVGHLFDVDCIRCQRCEPAGKRGKEPLCLNHPVLGIVKRHSGLADGVMKLFLALALVGILYHLEESREAAYGQVGSWRKIDAALVRRQMQSGRLAEREAQWYRQESVKGKP